MNAKAWFNSQSFHQIPAPAAEPKLTEAELKAAITRSEAQVVRFQLLADGAQSETVAAEYSRRAVEAAREAIRLDKLLPGRPCPMCGERGCTDPACASDARMEQGA